MSDKQKGLIEAFKTILPNVDHRFCVRHLHENFKRACFKSQTYKKALWLAATSTTTQYFKEAMENMKQLDIAAFKWFEDKDPKWSRSYFSTPKCDVFLNNICEVFNSFIHDARDKPVLILMSMIKDLVMVRIQTNRDKAELWDDRLCPKPRAKLVQNVKEASDCMPLKCDKFHYQVYSGGSSNQWVIDLEIKQCSCRKWQLNRIPCKHECATIRMNGENVEECADECYTSNTYKQMYIHSIMPMSGPNMWPQTGRVGPFPPPLVKELGS